MNLGMLATAAVMLSLGIIAMPANADVPFPHSVNQLCDDLANLNLDQGASEYAGGDGCSQYRRVR